MYSLYSFGFDPYSMLYSLKAGVMSFFYILVGLMIARILLTGIFLSFLRLPWNVASLLATFVTIAAVMLFPGPVMHLAGLDQLMGTVQGLVGCYTSTLNTLTSVLSTGYGL